MQSSEIRSPYGSSLNFILSSERRFLTVDGGPNGQVPFSNHIHQRRPDSPIRIHYDHGSVRDDVDLTLFILQVLS